MQNIFITGGTGYIGIRLIKLLLKEGFHITALVRKGSEKKLPEGCNLVVANPFNEETFQNAIKPGSIFIQLLGVPHPSPSKKELFRQIDLASVVASAQAAKYANATHFIYISVAQTPTNIMKDYQACRASGEAEIVKTNIPYSFIRPWYVVGPGHYWPLLFLPVLKTLELFPLTSKKAKALRLVYIDQILRTLLHATKNPPVNGIKIYEIEEIRRTR